MALSAYSLLLILTLLIFLFCYFIATRVWIRVDKKNIEQLAGKKIDSRRALYASSRGAHLYQ